MTREQAFELVQKELDRAEGKFKPYNSAHEAYGVIAEEFREFETEVFRKHRDEDAFRDEAVQVAVTAIRTLIDIAKAPA